MHSSSVRRIERENTEEAAHWQESSAMHLNNALHGTCKQQCDSEHILALSRDPVLGHETSCCATWHAKDQFRKRRWLGWFRKPPRMTVDLIKFMSFQDKLDYVAYVAKDVTEWRACYVLECGNEKAQSLISTMGQAFELRYKEFYGSEAWVKCAINAEHPSVDRLFFSDKNKNFAEAKGSCDQEYYNDLPGKVPPEIFSSKPFNKPPTTEKPRERISSNLIDLDTPIEHDYVNESKSSEVDDDQVFGDNTQSECQLHQRILEC